VEELANDFDPLSGRITRDGRAGFITARTPSFFWPFAGVEKPIIFAPALVHNPEMNQPISRILKNKQQHKQ
jgi:hypothetical protein